MTYLDVKCPACGAAPGELCLAECCKPGCSAHQWKERWHTLATHAPRLAAVGQRIDYRHSVYAVIKE